MGAEACRFEFLEHTADIKLRVWAKERRDLFWQAALGMQSFIFGDKLAGAGGGEVACFKVKADDIEALLVEWLSVLLYQISTQQVSFPSYQELAVSEHELQAKLYSSKADLLHDIKAVTWHGLKIVQSAERFQAEIVFDI
jgi:SHS2 domain-containing protein